MKTFNKYGPNGELEKEVWLPIPNYINYEASNYGRIRSKKTYWYNIMKQHIDGEGYYRINLTKEHKQVHSLIALTFLGPRPNGLVTNHRDNNKENNKPENLEYIENHVNLKQASKAGLSKRTERSRITNRATKLTEELIITAMIAHKKGVTITYLAHEIGVKAGTLSRALDGHTWKHLHKKQ